MSQTSITSLNRYPLSVVLAFLTEIDGTCLLLTQKHYTRNFLPLFRLKCPVVVKNNKHRHFYRKVPVQDPEILLDRLNTRRLRRRRRRRRLSPDDTSASTTCDPGYEYNKTTSELALSEWNYCQQNHPVAWPAPLELLRFLPPTDTTSFSSSPLPPSTTILASYPRSGNTLLRTLLERTTGVVTGSDTRPDRPLSRSLALDFDLVGEGVTTVTTTTCPRYKQAPLLVKTHFPERRGYPEYTAGKVILLVRNPFDAIDSYWNLNLTNTHTETVVDEVYARFQDKFEGLVKNEMAVWVRFHQYWMMLQSQANNIPLLIVRFEDLLKDPEQELSRILCFLLEEETEQLSNFWVRRIQHACHAESTCMMGSYRPRSAVGGTLSIGKSLRKERFSPELLQELHRIAKREPQGGDLDLLNWFGYDVNQHKFPFNFVDGKAPELPKQLLGEEVCFGGGALRKNGIDKPNSSAGVVHVNVGPMVRADNDPYGRPMRTWRHSHTNRDKNPFPTVAR